MWQILIRRFIDHEPYLNCLPLHPPCLVVADSVLIVLLNLPDYRHWFIVQVVHNLGVYYIGDKA